LAYSGHRPEGMEEDCIGSQGSKQSVMLDEENLLEVDTQPAVLGFRDQQHNQQTIQSEKKNSLQVLVLVLVLVWVPHFRFNYTAVPSTSRLIQTSVVEC